MRELGAAEIGPSQFPVKKCRAVLETVSGLMGLEFRLEELGRPEAGGASRAQILLARRQTGWCVCAPLCREAHASLETVADLIGGAATAESDMLSLSREVAECYEELNFLYEMSAEVGALLDERGICEFVVQRVAAMLECDRASVMLLDRERGCLRIYAAVGLTPEIVRDTEMQPGQGISGRAFLSGKDTIVKEGDPLPPDALRKKELERSVSFLSIPLKTSQPDRAMQSIGVINLTRKRGGRMFTSSDLKLVQAAAAQTATQIYNCRLLQATREQQELERELRIAAQIQEGLLPTAPLRIDSLEAAGLCRQARNVGGDFFDYWQQGDRISLVVADVCGHDLGAALLASELRSVIRSESIHHSSAADVVGHVNGILFDDLCRSELLITLFYAEIDTKSRLFNYSRAGHPRPLLVRRHRHEDWQTCWLDGGGPILGVERAAQFSEESIALRPGDTLVMYSDGVLEAPGPDGKQFGLEGVLQAAVRARDLGPAEVAAQIADCAQRHAAADTPRDDMTVLALRLLG